MDVGGGIAPLIPPHRSQPVESQTVIVDADDPARYAGGILRRLLGLVFPQT